MGQARSGQRPRLPSAPGEPPPGPAAGRSPLHIPDFVPVG